MSSVGTAVRLPLGSPGSGIELARFDPKRVQPGFAHVNRYFDRLLDHVVVKILPGEYYVTTQGEAVVTVLGSCVSACIRDRRSGIGGMNHFMLPESFPGEVATANGRGERYGNIAMEQLVNSVLKAGGDRRELEVKVFGGGRVLAQMTDVGKRNELIKKGLNYLSSNLAPFNREPSPGYGTDKGHYYFWYGHYYGVQAMYTAGSPYWEPYFTELRSQLLRIQRPDGSWPNDVGPGPAFGTAVGVLILEIPYRFLPIFQR